MCNWSSLKRKNNSSKNICKIVRNIKGNKRKEPFYIYIFHQGIRPTNYYGSTTIVNKSIKDDVLTLFLKKVNVFIDDEFNISFVSNMKAVSPVLEQIF